MSQPLWTNSRMESTAIARSSDDFWPRDPASHTTHVGINAFNSLFMSPVVQPDWDMFHSRHPAALLHATARVVRPSASLPTCLQQLPQPLQFLLAYRMLALGVSSIEFALPENPRS